MVDAVKLVFCGTPQFAVPTLAARCLRRATRSRSWCTQPDRPVGRTQELVAPPVKQTALAPALPVTQPEKIRTNAEFRAQLEAIAPDAIVVVAYGRIIPPWMLALPRFGCINLHGSLLPKYRGAAPIQWAVAMGETDYRQHDHAARGRPRHRADSAAAGRRDRSRSDGCRSFRRCWRQAARRWWWRRLPVSRTGAFSPRPQDHARRHVRAAARHAKMAVWISPRARRRSSRIAGADFSPGRARSPLLDGKKLIVHRMEVGGCAERCRYAAAELGQLVIGDQSHACRCARKHVARIARGAARRQEAHDGGGVSARDATRRRRMRLG